MIIISVQNTVQRMRRDRQAISSHTVDTPAFIPASDRPICPSPPPPAENLVVHVVVAAPIAMSCGSQSHVAQPPVLFVTRADGSARTPQASVPRRAPRRDRKPCQNRPYSPIADHTCVVHPTPSQAVPQLIAPTLPHRPIPCEACLQCHAACGKQPYKKCGRLCMKNHRSPVMHAYLK